MSDRCEQGDVRSNDALDVVAGAAACTDADATTGATMSYEHGVDADGLRVSKHAGAEDAAEAACDKPAGDCPSVEDMERFVDAVTTASWKAPSEEAEAAYRESLDALRSTLPPIMAPGTPSR